jgi:hypothetical protein
MRFLRTITPDSMAVRTPPPQLARSIAATEPTPAPTACGLACAPLLGRTTPNRCSASTWARTLPSSMASTSSARPAAAAPSAAQSSSTRARATLPSTGPAACTTPKSARCAPRPAARARTRVGRSRAHAARAHACARPHPHPRVLAQWTPHSRRAALLRHSGSAVTSSAPARLSRRTGVGLLLRERHRACDPGAAQAPSARPLHRHRHSSWRRRRGGAHARGRAVARARPAACTRGSCGCGPVSVSAVAVWLCGPSVCVRFGYAGFHRPPVPTGLRAAPYASGILHHRPRVDRLLSQIRRILSGDG